MVQYLHFLTLGLGLLSTVTGTIIQNGQVKPTNYPNTKIDPSHLNLTTYRADVREITYHGRWDSKRVPWWS